nr:H repeat-associated protein in rhsC-phrB intergenic region [Bradyrhizobium sp. DOA9]
MRCFARRILRTTPTRRRESYGQAQEGVSAIVGPAAADARHDLLEVLVIAFGGGSLRSRDLLRLGGVRIGQGRPASAVSAPRTWDSQPRDFRSRVPFARAGSLRGSIPAFFMAAFAKANRLNLSGVVAVDGKALRGAFARGSRHEPLHLVNVFAVEARMSLAQQKAPGRNETKGALEVLALLSLEGCLVTADALHCHRAMAKTVLDRGGD